MPLSARLMIVYWTINAVIVAGVVVFAIRGLGSP
jgi:hypothetical protein